MLTTYILKDINSLVFFIPQLIIMVQLRAQSEANFATVEVNVEDENDNPPSFSSVSILVSLMQFCILSLRYLLGFARFFNMYLKRSTTRIYPFSSSAFFS